MVPTDTSRRRVLRASCAAGVAALAGCLGGSDDEGDADDTDDTEDDGNGDAPGELPDVTPYAPYIAADTAEEATVAYADMDALATVEGFDDGAIEEADDPMLSIPASGLVLLSIGTITLRGAGLEPLLDGGDGIDSDIGEWVLAGQAFVAIGEIETDEVEQGLTEGFEGAPSGTTYERTDQLEGYDIYRPTEADSDATVAVSSEDIVAAEARPPVERVVEAVSGSRTHATAEFEAFEWVLDAAGDHHVAFAGRGERPQPPEEDGSFPELQGAESFAAGHTFEASEVSAEAAAVFESEAALDEVRDPIESAFGRAAEEVTVEFESDRFSAAGTYPEDLQIE